MRSARRDTIVAALCVLLLCWAYARAQTMSSSAFPDMSIYAKLTDLPLASTAVTNAPTTNGTAGDAGSKTFVPANAAQILVVQAVNTTTDGSGNWSVTFGQAFQGATPIISAFPIVAPGATQPMTCNVTARSQTTAAGKCFSGQTVVLNLSIITAGLTLNPNALVSSGTAVMIIGREPTQ